MSTPPPPLENAIFAIGDLVGGAYEIRALLGEGGMGQVFDAYDKNLSRRVAIKANFLEVQQSVRPEAQGLAAIRHAGVVGVYAFGSHRGIDYMVMEHVAGVTLAHHLERLEGAGLPLGERLDVLIAVADGLAAIHRAGISHGDVKPENILLSASGRVVLTDLGLVRAAYEQDAGLVAGTPAYMAPEIVSPKFAHAGWHLIDVYAFGVLAFRVLSGRLPFHAESPLDLVLQHAEEAPPKLVDITRLPRRLSDVVDKLLAKEPTERAQSMDVVVWQLRAAKEELEREESHSAASTLTVLVVDDDVEIARLVAMYVKQAAPAAEITIAKDAQQALDAFRNKPPRLVFLDLMMPKMSGFELFTYLRGVHLVDAATVVAMSAGGSPTDVQLMLELGAHDFIPKGPELRGRVTKIASMLAQSALPQGPVSVRRL